MVEPDDTIGAVKAYIQDEKGIPFKKQKLLNEEGRTLRDSHSLTSLGIKKCSTLILRYAPVTRIIVRNIVSGRVLEIMVWPDDTIGHVMAVIQEKHGIRFHRQKLTFCGNEHGDSERLANIGIRNDSILVVRCKSVTQIFVIYKFSGFIFKVIVDPDDTIGDVKAIICEKEGIPFHKQRLIFSGKECSDSELLTNLGIQDDSELILHHLSD
ncbi:PREDICTED: polyubiquitin-B-like [Nicotiana attenuata]|uniref:polyubiquitin-B-like n=1 Tax=Nicotiana attenuata TaxID=49451 RepID=UPI000905B340|nr:PREDICTED: polyubiquitin-B-like [Nicotiana attenuata]